jgi:hypothetical protein
MASGGAAGSIHSQVPVALRATATHGTVAVYVGCYRLVQVQPASKKVPPFRPIVIDGRSQLNTAPNSTARVFRHPTPPLACHYRPLWLLFGGNGNSSFASESSISLRQGSWRARIPSAHHHRNPLRLMKNYMPLSSQVCSGTRRISHRSPAGLPAFPLPSRSGKNRLLDRGNGLCRISRLIPQPMARSTVIRRTRRFSRLSSKNSGFISDPLGLLFAHRESWREPESCQTPEFNGSGAYEHSLWKPGWHISTSHIPTYPSRGPHSSRSEGSSERRS